MEKLDFIDSKFRLAILAAKRAKQLVGGSRKKINTDAENPLTIALEEIYQGLINFHILSEEEYKSRKNGFQPGVTPDADATERGRSFLFHEEEDNSESEEFLFQEDKEEDQQEAS